jgi:hypothetical protein
MSWLIPRHSSPNLNGGSEERHGTPQMETVLSWTRIGKREFRKAEQPQVLAFRHFVSLVGCPGPTIKHSLSLLPPDAVFEHRQVNWEGLFCTWGIQIRRAS